MKNYELISELMNLPAGYEVNFTTNVQKDKFQKDENSMQVYRPALSIESDDRYSVIEIVC